MKALFYADSRIITSLEPTRPGREDAPPRSGAGMKKHADIYAFLADQLGMR